MIRLSYLDESENVFRHWSNLGLAGKLRLGYEFGR